MKHWPTKIMYLHYRWLALYPHVNFTWFSLSFHNFTWFHFKPLSHCAIESYTLNLGECDIYEITKLYPIWAKLHFMLDVSKESKETFRKFFEGYIPSINEEVSANIQLSKFYHSDSQLANQMLPLSSHRFLQILAHVLIQTTTMPLKQNKQKLPKAF